MANKPTQDEAAKDRRQAQEWMKPPLSTEPSPVPESSLLQATLALGDSTDQLNQSVIANRNERKALQVTVILVIIVFFVQSFYGLFLFSKISDLAEQNNSLIRTAQSATSPDAVARSVERADYRMQLTIYCTNNFVQHSTSPDVALDARCPTTFPAPLSMGPTPPVG